MASDSYKREIKQIKNLLKDNPRGLTVTSIARKIEMNRNSVAKYLDIMRMSGHVEMKTFGPAKVYFLSHRVPISKMLNHVSDCVIVFDNDLKITLINDAFISFLDVERDEIIGQSMEETVLKMFRESLELSLGINEALNGKKTSKKLSFKTEESDIYLKIKAIPTIFESGKNGAALIINKMVQDRGDGNVYGNQICFDDMLDKIKMEG